METAVNNTINSMSRFKGASWFNKIYGRDVLIIGQGGIASWLSILVARTGANLITFDGDRVEQHNMSGQLFKSSQIGMAKVDAVAENIREFCTSDDHIPSIETFTEMYGENSPANPIVLTGLDNMVARRVSFLNWIKFIEENPELENECLFIDGRLNAEKLQIFCIKGTDKHSQKIYLEKYLFSDNEVEEQDCTFKQTSHCAAMIAAHMVGFLTNFFGEEFREVPFIYSYVLPINLTTDELE